MRMERSAELKSIQILNSELSNQGSKNMSRPLARFISVSTVVIRSSEGFSIEGLFDY